MPNGSAINQGGGIYLDYHASTPVDPLVLEAMYPWWNQQPGNPHSGEHAFGWSAAAAVELARNRIANLLTVDGEDIVFTSGATEANNLAILGLFRNKDRKRRTLLTTSTEHASVLGPAEALMQEGVRCLVLPVDNEGYLRRDAFLEALSDDVLLVSIGAVNNEIGTIQDMAWIAEQCHAAGALLHTDAAQAVSAIPLPLSKWNVDLASVSAHKAYGPQGVGALFIAPWGRSQMRAQSFGGSQQLGMRPGSLPTALCVGFGAAADILHRSGAVERERIRALRDWAVSKLLESIPGGRLVGAPSNRHPGNVSFRLPNADARDLVQRIQPHVAISTGSACHSGSDLPSHVLRAIGMADGEARNVFRLGIGRYTTQDDLSRAVSIILEELAALSR